MPYSCLRGACASCRGLIRSGEFDTPYPEDVYILFCQTRPKSDLVIAPREIRRIDPPLPLRRAEVVRGIPEGGKSKADAMEVAGGGAKAVVKTVAKARPFVQPADFPWRAREL